MNTRDFLKELLLYRADMNAGELKAALADIPDDTIVVLQKDGEGNGYSPLAGMDEAAYLADSTWSGDVYELDGEDEDAPPDDAVKCVLLFPVN